MTERRYDTIRVERDGAVATLTMDRPERMNAMTNRMVLEVGAALDELAGDEGVRVLVLTESERHLGLFALADTREAFAARVEKRAPRFEGR